MHEFEIKYLSRLDNSMQPALWHPARSTEARPLVVALHTWSYDHLTCPWDMYLDICVERDWHIIYPAFRGPNWTSEACGSELVISDIAGALEYAKSVSNVDEKRVYLIGGSGGGHASLLMAGRYPGLWSAVSAWCPISNIKLWHRQCREVERFSSYADHIEAACGGNPQITIAAAAEAARRSPASTLANAAGKTIIDINTGIHDGHTGSVPVSHSINAYNILAAAGDRIAAEDIDVIVKNEVIPEHLRYDAADPAYGEHKVLMRKVSGNVRLTIFEGGHTILPNPGLNWCAQQSSGALAVWDSAFTASENAAVELTR